MSNNTSEKAEEKAASENSEAKDGPNLVDDFEKAFQICISSASDQEHFNILDTEEARQTVDQSIRNFIEVAKRLETMFLQKRFLLSVYMPEQIVQEETSQLRTDLQRKDLILHQHWERLSVWQAHLKAQKSIKQTMPSHPMAQMAARMPQRSPAAAGHMQVPMMQMMQQAVAGPAQGPLAYLEQTTSNIGAERR